MRPVKPCPCGAPKLPGQGQRYCADCREARVWRAERRKVTLTVVSRKPCIDCGGIKEPGHGRRLCTKCVAKRKLARAVRRKAMRHYYCRGCGVETGRPWATCDACHAKAIERRKERMKVYRARWNRTHRRRRRMSKVERENRKIDYRLKREREGKPVTRKPPNGVLKRWDGAYVEVSAAPLLPYLERRLSETPSTVLGEVAKVNPTRLESIVQLKASTIALGAADRLCVELGVPFAELYGGVER